MRRSPILDRALLYAMMRPIRGGCVRDSAARCGRPRAIITADASEFPISVRRRSRGGHQPVVIRRGRRVSISDKICVVSERACVAELLSFMDAPYCLCDEKLRHICKRNIVKKRF